MRTARPGTGPRVVLARVLRVAAIAVLAAAVAALVAAWVRAGRILERLDGRTDRARARLVEALRKDHGVSFYAPLDERAPADFVTGLPLLGSAAVRVPGVFGSARRFDGRPGENLVALAPRWTAFGRSGLTLALWARLPDDGRGGERRLVWDRTDTAGIGLRVSGGRLEASFGDASGLRVLSAPAPEPGRFAHLALSVGGERAALYVDGAERDACAVSAPVALRSHTLSIGTDGHFPPSMDVDEWCVFRRPIPSDEIARLAGARRPIPEALEPRLAARLRRLEAQAASFRSLLGTLGAFRTAGTAPAVLNRSIPALELRLSRADRRHFRAAHLEALSSGFRTRLGAKARRIRASFGGRTERIRAWLDETVPDTPGAARPAFVLAAEGGLFGDGSGLMRLFPPEQFGARRPDAARPLPLDPSILVRLQSDGNFLGLYCLVPFEGPAAPWFATGGRDVSRTDRLHFSAPATDPASGAGLTGPGRDEAWRRMLALLRTDASFPLGPAEAEALAKRHVRNREVLCLAEPEPGPDAVLGANPAALYVTEDLDLAAAGRDLEWRSSDPATISPEGRVRRPDDGRPRIVELAAAAPGGAERTLRFRVMPEKPALPALFLHFGRPLDKLARTDFACLRIPAGDDAEPSWLSGTGAGGGGAKLRGNTSYVTGRRRSINLKFDAPVLFPGIDAPVRHLLLLSGYADPTRLRNALSFDAFRAMSPGDTVRATPVVWTEVFVNGAYAGVWECCPRLQDALSETYSDLYKVRSSHGLWSDPSGAVENVDRVGGDPDADDPYAPLRDIVRLVSGTDRAAFVAAGGDAFDVDEIIDFYLLLNFTGNEDGRVTNQYIGRRAEDGRWMILPWDYDKTFLPNRTASLAAAGRSAFLSNSLLSRLIDRDPARRERLSARWRELRAGPLSDAALDAWIDERAALLGPSMDEDYRVAPPFAAAGGFDDAIAALRSTAHARAAWLDRVLAR